MPGEARATPSHLGYPRKKFTDTMAAANDRLDADGVGGVNVYAGEPGAEECGRQSFGNYSKYRSRQEMTLARHDLPITPDAANTRRLFNDQPHATARVAAWWPTPARPGFPRTCYIRKFD
jgi:hypothetical protein